jgi:hypothetical protein
MPSHNVAEKLRSISAVLKKLGYARQHHVKLYGQQFELLDDPIAMTETLVVVDAIEEKTGRTLRLRIPLNVVNMATAQTAA